ncbi:MAG TPA: dihydrolipoyl dehydrogenase, partial [Chromatiales bacterium]|nr:dihydrolipoyl dehydrogenase [Chromatiales bacterium]
VGDRVSKGTPIVVVEADESAGGQAPSGGETEAKPAARPRAAAGADLHCEVLVLGSGPGGYTAAFRAADLGKRVVLVERHAEIGGVCLNVGCIPSKALLHAAQILNEARAFAQHGIRFGDPEIDLDALRTWKDGVVRRLTGGLRQLAKQRHVEIVRGTGRFVSPTALEVTGPDGQVRVVSFEHAIVAVGSHPVRLPLFPWDDPRVMDSTGALALRDVPERLLVVGGGIIGLEMATVYHALGSRVTVVELTDQLIPGCDSDLVRPLVKIVKPRYEAILTGTRVTACEATAEGLKVSFQGPKAPETAVYDRVLVATGRAPNGNEIGAEAAGLEVDPHGFIPSDSQMRTNVAHIFSIGDVRGHPMLAHKATHEAKVAAEVIAGLKSHFDARVIPSVAYTDPEVAWVGTTEAVLKAQGVTYDKGVFPWAASGRSLSLGRAEGMTKLLFDERRRLVGAGIVGPNAGELVAEVTLGIEMDVDPEDLALTIHPHPTLSETIAFAAEVVDGTITDLYVPKRK